MGVVKLSTAGIVNYQKYDDFLAGNAAFQPGVYEWLETEVLTGDQTSVTFSNLNSTYGSTYKHLEIRMVTFSANDGWFNIKFNGNSTGANYRAHLLFGNGSSVTSMTFAGSSDGLGFVGQNGSTTVPAGNIVTILDAFSTTKNKTVRTLGGNGSATVTFTSGAFFLTDAITSLQISTGGTTFKSGSRFSLYGIRSVNP